MNNIIVNINGKTLSGMCEATVKLNDIIKKELRDELFKLSKQRDD